jgi:hypothetical protein
VRNLRLDQHGIRSGDGPSQRIQIGWHRDSHDPPDLKSGAAKPLRHRSRIRPVELCPAKPCPFTYLEDFLERLASKNPQDRNTWTGGDNLAGSIR